MSVQFKYYIYEKFPWKTLKSGKIFSEENAVFLIFLIKSIFLNGSYSNFLP